MSQELVDAFKRAFKSYMEPKSGWSGSEKAAGNILLVADEYLTGEFGVPISPYQIPAWNSELNLQDTINLKAIPTDTAKYDKFNILRSRSGLECYKFSRSEGEDSDWELRGSFWAYTQDPGKGAVQYYICDAPNPQRFSINKTGSVYGWKKRDSFWAFPNNPGDGAVKYNILYTEDPWRYNLIKDDEEGSQGSEWIPGAGFGKSTWCFFPSDNWNYDTAIQKASEKCQPDNCGGFSVYKYDKQDRFFCFRGKDTYKTDGPVTGEIDNDAKCFLPINGYGNTFVDQGVSQYGCQSMDDDPKYDTWKVANYSFWAYPSKPVLDLPLPSRRDKACSIENINTEPCYGAPTTDGKYSIHSGCDGSNYNYTYPTKGYLENASPTTLPVISDPSGSTITLGQWTRRNGSGPKKNIINYSTTILAPPKAFRGVNGAAPSPAKIHINIMRLSLGQARLLESDDLKTQLCNHVSNSIPPPTAKQKSILNEMDKRTQEYGQYGDKTVGDAWIKSNDLKAEWEDCRTDMWLDTIWTCTKLTQDETRQKFAGLANHYVNVVNIWKGWLVELSDQYLDILPEILKIILRSFIPDEPITYYQNPENWRIGSDAHRSSKTPDGYYKVGGETVSRIGIARCIYDNWLDYQLILFDAVDAWRYSNKNYFRTMINDKYKDQLNKLLPNTLPVYRPISVAFAFTNSCGLTGQQQPQKRVDFPFAKATGEICLPNGCNADQQSNEYCSCRGDTPYQCPFESYSNNLTNCQATIELDPTKATRAIDPMRNQILYWFNTLVGTNGCFQRSLAMAYGKCLGLNTENLNIANWVPSKNKIGVHKYTNQNVYQQRKL